MRPVFLLTLAALMWGSALFVRSPQRQQELRVLVTARNMVQAGDWLHFEFQNQPRYRKPPLAYWAAATGFTLTGQQSSAWAGRLLFVVTGLVGLWLFRDLAGDRAALLFLFTYGSLVYAPLAETDFLQLVGLILSFWGWKRSFGWLSGLGMAAAVLAKGPGGVAIPLISFLLLSRSYPKSLHFWISALLLPLIAGGGWILYLQVDPVASAALAADLKATFLDTAHRNPLPYYVWTLPLVMIPAVFLLPWARSKETSPEHRIPIIWFWVTFILLTLTISKQRHYALMLLPPACWWLGLRLSDLRFRMGLIIPLAAMVILANVATAFFSEDARHARFLDKARQIAHQSDTLHVVGINSARFDFHLGRHVHNTDSVQNAYDRARPGDAVFVVTKADSWQDTTHLPDPRLKDDDGTWIRRVYQKH